MKPHSFACNLSLLTAHFHSTAVINVRVSTFSGKNKINNQGSSSEASKSRVESLLRSSAYIDLKAPFSSDNHRCRLTNPVERLEPLG